MPDNVAVVIIFASAIAFGLSNGLNDAANAIAASIGSRAIRPRNALILAAVCNLAGAMTGTAVAKLIGKGIIPGEPSSEIVIGAIFAAVLWTLFATSRGLPISVSHSLVAGLVGAGLATVGTSGIGWAKFYKTLAAVVTAPALGFIGALVMMIILLWIFHKYRPGFINRLFRRGQWLTTGFLAYAHGKNDGQMPIAIMMMGWVIYHDGDLTLWDNIPIWITLVAASSISLGTALGGWRVIKTLGFRVTNLRPIHGFTSDGASAGVIELASHIGVPVSTTHCAVASVVGVGATERLSAVRWGVARSIVIAWILTFPICGGLGYLLTKLLMQF